MKGNPERQWKAVNGRDTKGKWKNRYGMVQSEGE